MRILFISDNFPPEVNAPANRTFEHAKRWVDSGEDVSVITCAPNFPEGKLMAGYKNRLFQEEVQQGINVTRVWSYITANKGFLKRSLDYISFAVSASFAGLFKRCDVVIATSPQFFVACAGCLLATIRRKPWILEVRDLWPESIVAVGALKPGLLLSLLERIERFLYRSATAIVVVTDTFKERLVDRGIAAAKIHVVKNGVDLRQFGPTVRNKALAEQLGVEAKRVVMYAGTLGMAHGIDFIVRAAHQLSSLNRYLFVIIGAGAESENVKQLISELDVENVVLLPPVARSELLQYLSIADVSLVNLKRNDTFKTVLPSKIFESAAMGIPILLGVEGEAKKLIEDFKAGVSFVPEDYNSFRRSLLAIDQASEIGAFTAGCLNLSAAFDRNALADRMLEIIKSSARTAKHQMP